MTICILTRLYHCTREVSLQKKYNAAHLPILLKQSAIYGKNWRPIRYVNVQRVGIFWIWLCPSTSLIRIFSSLKSFYYFVVTVSRSHLTSGGFYLSVGTLKFSWTTDLTKNFSSVLLGSRKTNYSHYCPVFDKIVSSIMWIIIAFHYDSPQLIILGSPKRCSIWQ